jgi:hypothetical protein
VFANPTETGDIAAYADQRTLRGEDLVSWQLDGTIMAEIRAADLLPE